MGIENDELIKQANLLVKINLLLDSILKIT